MRIGPPDPVTGCWPWLAGKDTKGYGHLTVAGRRTKAHRISYELYKGAIPKDLVIDHLCRNPSCVNPEHLEAVTFRENLIRGIGPAAVNAAKTHCVHGHEFSEANTYVTKAGFRQCRQCRRDRRASSSVAT